eukprot:scaffold1484_cov241-Pinguiococcus_pyrenoidosus.AAC.14
MIVHQYLQVAAASIANRNVAFGAEGRQDCSWHARRTEGADHAQASVKPVAGDRHIAGAKRGGL